MLWSVIQKLPAGEFNREHPLDVIGIIALAFDVLLHHSFHKTMIEVRTPGSAAIQKDFLHIIGQLVPKPDPEVRKTMTPDQQAFRLHRP